MDSCFSIALPLKRKTRLDAGEFITELRLFVEETGAEVRLDPRMINQPQGGGWSLRSLMGNQPEKILFDLGGVRMRVTVINEPFYERSRIHRYVNPAMWSTGLGEFADHRAHVLIHEAGIEGEEGPDAVFDRASAVTATASVVARLTEPVGAIWVSARNAVPMSTFNAGVERLKGGEAPLKLWIRWHIIAPGQYEEACSGIVTCGLAPFAGREIQAQPGPTEPRVMIDYAFELARKLVDEGLAIEENCEIDTADGGPLRLRLRGPGANSDAPVFEISLPQSPLLEAPRPAEPAPAADLGLDQEAARRALAEMQGLPAGLPPLPPAPPELPAPSGPEAAPIAVNASPLPPADDGTAGGAPEPGPETAEPAEAARVYAAGGRRIRVIAGGKSGR